MELIKILTTVDSSMVKNALNSKEGLVLESEKQELYTFIPSSSLQARSGQPGSHSSGLAYRGNESKGFAAELSVETLGSNVQTQALTILPGPI